MPSTLDRKLRYLKDRCVNAYWMVREGRFKLILESISIEISHRVADFQDFLLRNFVLEARQYTGSAFVNKRKVLPPSYRPTILIDPPSVSMQADRKVVASELSTILSSFTFQESKDS